MVSKTTEQALEACIEKALTGTCKEERGWAATRLPDEASKLGTLDENKALNGV